MEATGVDKLAVPPTDVSQVEQLQGEGHRGELQAHPQVDQGHGPCLFTIGKRPGAHHADAQVAEEAQPPAPEPGHRTAGVQIQPQHQGGRVGQHLPAVVLHGPGVGPAQGGVQPGQRLALQHQRDASPGGAAAGHCAARGVIEDEVLPHMGDKAGQGGVQPVLPAQAPAKLAGVHGGKWRRLSLAQAQGLGRAEAVAVAAEQAQPLERAPLQRGLGAQVKAEGVPAALLTAVGQPVLNLVGEGVGPQPDAQA